MSSVAELHDLTSRGNQGAGNLKPDMSMYHHHMMQSRQATHPGDMHDFLAASDPMSAAAASLPAALSLATSSDASGGTGGGGGTNSGGNGHQGSVGVANQLHSTSSLYSSHHHSAMNSKSFQSFSFAPMSIP